MKDLKGYANYLRQNHLDELAVMNLDLALEMEIPLMQLYIHLPRQQLIDGTKQSYETFLSSLDDGTSILKAKENIQLWEEDKIPGFAQDSLGPSDLILIYAIQKKVLIKFLPHYTRNIVEVVNIVHELDAHYMEVQNLAITALFRIKKKTSDKLVESEEKYRNLIENANDLIHISDIEGNIQYANVIWLKTLEYTLEEIQTKSINEVVHPDDLKKYTLERDKALQGETGREFSFVFLSKSGKKVFMEGSINCQFDNGKPVSTRGMFKDISLRRANEKKLNVYLEKLKESEESLRLLLENVTDCSIFMVDPEGIILNWNAGAENIYGYSSSEILGKNISQFYSEEDVVIKTEPGRNLKLAIENGRYECEEWRVKKDKSQFWANVIYTALFDETGKVTSFVKVTRDVSERKRKDEKIEKTLKQLSEAQQMAHIGSWEYDLITETISWSDELYRIYGREPDNEIIKPGDNKKYSHPDDIKTIDSVIAESMKNKTPFNFNYRIITDDKVVKTLHSQGVFITDESSNIIKLTGTLQDITERKRAEDKIEKTIRQLSQAQQMAQIGSWEWDMVSNSISWSDELYRIWGFEPQEFPPQFHRYLNFIHPDDRESAQKIISKAIKSKHNFQFEHRILTKKGELKIINSQGRIVIDKDGKYKALSGTAQDITESVQTKTELKKAEELVKAKQQFLSNMSHEIRTPMNAIIGFTKLVLKTELNPIQKEYIEAIKVSGDTMMVLINDILDLAKVDEGKIVFEKVPFMLSDSLTVMLRLFETKMQEKNIQLHKKYDTNIPKVLIGDSIRLHQIILNLMSNAVKFTKRGNIVVEAKLIYEEEDNATIELSFSDSGIGIPTEKLDTIFENFQQAHDNTTRLYGGTGLGLAIVRQLVERQGGSIRVKSEVGIGSVFTIILNYKKANKDFELKFNEDLDSQNEIEIKLAKTKVLIVEDIPLNQLLIKTILTDFGCEQEVAENGQIAIEKLSNGDFDLVLMDLQMPVLNGFEATEYIRKNLKMDVPIIGLTADVTTTILDRCIEVGMNDYLSKPINEQLLHNKIMNSLRGILKSKNTSGLLESLEMTEKKFTNMDYLKKRTKENKKLMCEMITIFVNQTPVLIENLKEGIINTDWGMIYSAIHALIPSFSMVGLESEYEQKAKRIQEYAQEKHSMEKIRALTLKIETVCEKAIIELVDELKKLDSNSTYQPKFNQAFSDDTFTNKLQ